LVDKFAPHLDFLAMTPEGSTLTASTLNLVHWLSHMLARPSMQATTWERVGEAANAVAISRATSLIGR
jgi:glutathione S-transferase